MKKLLQVVGWSLVGFFVGLILVETHYLQHESLDDFYRDLGILEEEDEAIQNETVIASKTEEALEQLDEVEEEEKAPIIILEDTRNMFIVLEEEAISSHPEIQYGGGKINTEDDIKRLMTKIELTKGYPVEIAPSPSTFFDVIMWDRVEQSLTRLLIDPKLLRRDVKREGTFFSTGVLLGDKFWPARGSKNHQEEGVYVAGIICDSPAYRSGIRVGDRFVAVGKQIASSWEIVRRLEKKDANNEWRIDGDIIMLTMLRPGSPEPVEVEVALETFGGDGKPFNFFGKCPSKP